VKTPTTILLSVVLGMASSGCPAEGTEARVLDYVRADDYTKLVLEVDSVASNRPTGKTRKIVVNGVRDIVNKPDGVFMEPDQTLPGSPDTRWTQESLDALADTYETYRPEDGTTTIYTMFVEGTWHEDDGDRTTLGVAWDHHRIAIFVDPINAFCGDQEVLCDATQNTIWLHELGHVLGLVDNGVPMVHDHRDPDPDKGAHDSNEDCIMHWSVSKDGVLERIKFRVSGGNENPMGFGEECLADLAAIRDAP